MTAASPVARAARPTDRLTPSLVAAKLSDAAYHVNNLLSPVRFRDALREVPAHAVVVEVAPHALLAAVLRRAMPGAAHVPLVRRDSPDPRLHLLAAVGK